jgi:hypothetical protein
MSITRRLSLKMMLLAASGSLPGCALMRNWFGPRDPFAAGAPCVLSSNATSVEVVNHLNANTSRIGAWRADHVKIVGRGQAQMPVSVSADLAIEAPRNFRLRVNSLGGEEVDLGSNAEQFWFWNRRAEEKCIYVAYHDGESAASRRFPIPFQPEWIMETFGVIPIDASSVTAQPGPNGSRTIHLTSEVDSPLGGTISKLTVVDICHGVVIEQALYDAQGNQIASARMSQFAHHAVPGTRTSVVLPRQIDLDWPKAGIGLTMVMNQIDVNPQRIPERIWKRPEKEGYEVCDLSR